MIHFVAGLLFLYCASSEAFETCMSVCNERGSEITIETSCAAPGGEISRSTQYYYDECKDNVMKDYSCVGSPSGDHVLTQERPLICSDNDLNHH